MKKAAVLIAAVAALTVTPSVAVAAPGAVDLRANYTSNGVLGAWYGYFFGTATTNGDGTYTVTGRLETRCPSGVVNGFGRFGFHNQNSSGPWREFDVNCNGDEPDLKIEATASGDPGDDIGITVCMGGLLLNTGCGGERTVRLS